MPFGWRLVKGRASPTTASAARAAEKLVHSGVVAVVRGRFQGSDLLDLARALVGEGIDCIELTMNSTDALGGIRALASELGDDALIGAGTIRSADDAHRAIEAGARFLVSPHFGRDVSDVARSSDTLLVPGVFTATEAQAALEAGHSLLKLFPADVGGPSYMKALMAPLDDARFIPTGGIGPDNARAYVAAGAAAVGLGGDLTRPWPDLQRVADVARRVVQAVRDGRRDRAGG